MKSWLKTHHSKHEDHGIWSHQFMANRCKTMETVKDFILLGSKITADGDCSHENKRFLILGRKVMTDLDRVLKSRDITWPTKIHIVKADFSSSHVWMWDLAHKERWLDSIINPMDMNLSKLWEIVEDSRIRCDAVHRVTKSHLTDWTTTTTGKESHWLVQ